MVDAELVDAEAVSIPSDVEEDVDVVEEHVDDGGVHVVEQIKTFGIQGG